MEEEDNGEKSDGEEIETIDTSTLRMNHLPRDYDQIVQNLIEEDVPYSTKTEVKLEPEDYQYPGLNYSEFLPENDFFRTASFISF